MKLSDLSKRTQVALSIYKYQCETGRAMTYSKLIKKTGMDHRQAMDCINGLEEIHFITTEYGPINSYWRKAFALTQSSMIFMHDFVERLANGEHYGDIGGGE